VDIAALFFRDQVHAVDALAAFVERVPAVGVFVNRTAGAVNEVAVANDVADHVLSL
jgi:hypothetical protein